jgi:hypothetical protein
VERCQIWIRHAESLQKEDDNRERWLRVLLGVWILTESVSLCAFLVSCPLTHSPFKLHPVIPTRKDHDELKHPPLAEYSPANWIKKIRPSLIVRDRGLAILDDIIVSFFLVESKRQNG